MAKTTLTLLQQTFNVQFVPDSARPAQFTFRKANTGVLPLAKVSAPTR